MPNRHSCQMGRKKDICLEKVSSDFLPFFIVITYHKTELIMKRRKQMGTCLYFLNYFCFKFEYLSCPHYSALKLFVFIQWSIISCIRAFYLWCHSYYKKFQWRWKPTFLWARLFNNLLVSQTLRNDNLENSGILARFVWTGYCNTQ